VNLVPGISKNKKLDERWLEIDGCRIFMRYSETAGTDRPPFVLIHGLSMSSNYLVPTAEHLAPFYRVYLPDLPGFGRSDKPKNALSIPQLARRMAAWMDALNLGPAYFLGNSMGCNFIVQFALQYPERVLKTVLIGPTVDERARNFPENLFNGARNILREPVGFLAIAIKDYLEHGLRRTVQTLRYGIEDEIEDKLPRIKVPSLVIRGEGDTIVSQPWAEKVARLLPNGRLVVIPDGAHVVHFEHPGAVAAEVDAFIADSDIVQSDRQPD
jgi:2-hydroxy-6-oxonona-2,4-dienedioate hydrolase